MKDTGKTVCRTCLSDRLQPVLDLGMQPWGNHFVPISGFFEIPRYPLQLFFCHDCTMAQIAHTVPKETMFVHHGYLSGTTGTLKRHFSGVRDRILDRAQFRSGDYILDVGGNDGTFLALFRERDIPVLNVESGVRQTRISRENGIPCVNRFFNEEAAAEILRERGPARVIHGSGIFFHMEELQSAFRGIKRLLHPDGLVAAEFIYLPDMVRQCAYDQIYHEHLMYFRLASFDRFLRGQGLSIVDAVLTPIHGGSCLAFITHAEREPASDGLRRLVAAEAEGGFDRVETYLAFAERARNSRDKLRRMVRELRAEGQRIQFLGAPVKGSTIVNYCGFTPEDVECAVEINPLKCDTYYPGTRIPVFHQDAVKPPDVYLLLSWNFKDEILAKLDGFRKTGRILVPIPDPVIL